MHSNRTQRLTNCWDRLTLVADFNSNHQSSVEDNFGANASSISGETFSTNAGFARPPPPSSGPSEYKSFLTHPVRIHHATWTAASTTTTLTNDLVGLYRTNVAATPMGSKIANFMRCTSKIRIKVVTQGQPFAGGQVVLSFAPNVSVGFDTAFRVSTVPTTLTNSKIVPHLVLDPSKTQTYEIDLPVCTPSGYWYLAGPTADNLGSYLVTLTAFNPLISGTATAPTLGICVYMSFLSDEFDGLTLLSADPITEKKEGGTLSNLVNGAADSSLLLKPIFPSLSPYITVFSGVVGGVGRILAALGFSKPQNVENQVFVMNRQADNYSQFDGKSTAVTLAGSIGNSVGISPSIGGGSFDEMTISTIAAKKGLIRQVTVTQAMAAEAVVVTLPVSPTLINFVAPNFLPTPLSGISVPFAYWTGDLTFTLEFVATVFHRATLLVAWNPRIDAATPSFASALETLQNVTVNIAGNTSVEITIPWKQVVPWKRVKTYSSVDATHTSTYCNGEFHIYVINPVTANGSTDGVMVNIYAHSNNIAYAVPSHERASGVGELAEVLLSSEFCPVNPVSFGPRTNLVDITKRSFGEEYTSVKQLTSKLGPYSGRILVNSVTGMGGIQIANYPMLSYNGFANPYENLFTYISSAYLGYRGSIRYMCHIHELKNAATPQRIGKFYWARNIKNDLPIAAPSSAAVTTNAYLFGQRYAYTCSTREIAPNSDVVCPMLLPVDFFPTRGRYTTYDNFVEFYANFDTPTTPADWVDTFEIYNASGDDGNFVWFVGFPAVY
jgi:hypothetical protein